MQQTIEQYRRQLEACEALLSVEIGEQRADVVLAWLLHNPVLTSVIIGPRGPVRSAGRSGSTRTASGPR